MQSENGVSLSQIMHAISPHLLALGTEVAKLEEIIGPNLTGKSTRSLDMIVELQTLDRLRQSILDIARLTRHVSEIAVDGMVPRSQMDAIAQTLHLSVTKALLRGENAQQLSVDRSESQADLHLF